MANSKKRKKYCAINMNHKIILKILFSGESCESIQGAKLSTTRQILQYILYLKEISLPNCPIYGLIKQAVKEVFVNKFVKYLANMDAVKKNIKTDNLTQVITKE